MPKKVLGRAQYSAYRLGGFTHLIAIGETPNFNDKVDFEELPFLIYPPMWAFYLIKADVGLPAMKPFKYEETIIYPKSAKSIRVQDADGYHDVKISEIDVPDVQAESAGIVDLNFCVFSWIGINSLMIAKCDAAVPAVYTRVFGPASRADCEKYVRENGGVV